MNELFSSRIDKRKMYLIYWTCYVMLFTLIQGMPTRDFIRVFHNELIGLIPKIIFVAIIIELLMDKLLFKKKMGQFVLIYIALLLVFAFIQRLLDNYVIIKYFLTHWKTEPLLSVPPYLYSIIKLQFVVTIPFSFKLFYYWANEQNKVQTIQSEKMQAELQSLRNQFHPHFIFNVLNNLYAKVLSKSDDSADIVLKISSLLRFSVYEANGKTISLAKELEYLADYISLQRMRFSDSLELSFSVTGDTENKVIEPFLLIPFIENSFKYCMKDDEEGGWITIFISVNDDWLNVKIENSLGGKEGARPGDKGPFVSGGFGLVNVKKRLDLLYPDSYSLKITEGEDSFYVGLRIKLYEAN